jgi:long-subunit acyl-CoA synthetase (AMP-forming)
VNHFHIKSDQAQIFYPLVQLGVIGSGGCFIGSNPTQTILELKHLFTISQPKILIIEPELAENVLPAAEECGIPSSNIFIFNTRGQAVPDGFHSWETLLKNGQSDWIKFNDEKSAKSTTAVLLSTSGTSGLPKVAAMSHYALVAANIQAYNSKYKPYEVFGFPNMIGIDPAKWNR